MKLLRLILIVIILFAALFEVSATEISHVKNINSLSNQTLEIAQELNRLNFKLDSILSRIYTYKEQQEKDYSIFREFGLRSLLKKAQSLTEHISDLDRKKNLTDKKLQRERELLYVEYNKEIDRLLAQFKLNIADKPSFLNKLKKVMTARAELSPHISAVYRSEVDSIYIDSSDSAKDILEKARILDDYKQRLARELSIVEQKLETLKKHSYALNELSHLIEEESFFTETGFLKAVKRKDSSSELDPASEETKTGKDKDSTKSAVSKDSSETTEPNSAEASENTSESETPGTATQNENSNTTEIAQTTSSTSSSTSNDNNSKTKDSENSILSLFSRQETKTDSTDTETANTEISPDSTDTNATDSSDDKRTRLYNGNEITTKDNNTKITEKTLTSDSEIDFLEKERENLKNLILEVQKRRNSLTHEADKIRVLKMK